MPMNCTNPTDVRTMDVNDVFPIILKREANKDETIQKLKNASSAIASALASETAIDTAPPMISPVIHICDTVLGEDTLEAVMELIALRQTKTAANLDGSLRSLSSPATISFMDCNAVYLERPMIRKALAEALGNCQYVGFLDSPTFLSKPFLEDFLASACTGKLKVLRIKHRFNRTQIQTLAEVLSEGLLSNKILHTLDLCGSTCDHTADFAVLLKALRDGCKNLKHLNLRYMGLRDNHLEAMLGDRSSTVSLECDAPCPIPALESLYLSPNRLRVHLATLGNYLAHSDCNLRTLSMGHNDVLRNGDLVGISRIAQALETNKTLTSLSLPRIGLRNSDAILLAAALAKNSSLEFLDVGSNEILDIGIMRLAGLAFKGSLKSLRVAENPFGYMGSMGLLVAASENHEISHIHVDDCSHTDRDIQKEIRFQTALNRGPRRLIGRENIPRGLWPLAFERSQLVVNETKGEKYPYFWRDEDLRSDVLYYLLKDNSTFIVP